MFEVNPNSLPGPLADLVRVPIDYVFEVHYKGKLYKKLSTSLPNTPSERRVVWDHGFSLESTLGTDPIREHTERRFGRIVVSGRTGIQARSGYDRKGNIVFQSGPKVLAEFDEFLKTYQNLAAEKGAQSYRDPEPFVTPGVELIFRDLVKDIHVKVEIDDWQMSSNVATTRHSEEWSLALQVYGLAKRKVPKSILAPLDSWAAKATGVIASVNALGALVSNALVNARGDLDALRAPLQELQRTGQVASQIFQGAGSIARFPKDVLSDLAAAAESFANAWQEAEIVGDEARRDYLEGGLTRDFTDRLKRIGWLADDAARDSATLAGAMGAGPGQRRSGDQSRSDIGLARSGVARRNFPRRGPPVDMAGVYTLRQGDTLQDLALSLFGDASRWVEIAYFNGFLDAYTDAQGHPLRPGSVVLLPGFEAPDTVVERIEGPDDLFGRDIYCDPTTGDFEIIDNELRTVSGPENLRLSLRRRLTTEQGTARLFPGYGLPVAPGDASHPRMIGYVSAHIREQLTSDARISNVADLAVVSEGDRMDISFSVVPTQGASVAVIAPMRPGA